MHMTYCVKVLQCNCKLLLFCENLKIYGNSYMDTCCIGVQIRCLNAAGKVHNGLTCFTVSLLLIAPRMTIRTTNIEAVTLHPLRACD